MEFRPFNGMPTFTSHSTDDEGYLKSLCVDGKNILTKWGIEFSDGDRFFIQNQKSHAPYEVESVALEKNHTRATLLVHLTKSTLRILVDETFTPTKITRKYTITPLQDTHFMDISISQAFEKKVFEHVEMNGLVLPFDGIERNHQFEVNHALLVGKDFDIEVHFDSPHNRTGLTPTIYARSGARFGWAIHSRLFPKQIAKKAIMWCNAAWNKRIPFSDLLSKIDPLVDYLWYVGEKPQLSTRRTYGFASFGLALAPKNTPIELVQTLTLKSKKEKK